MMVYVLFECKIEYPEEYHTMKDVYAIRANAEAAVSDLEKANEDDQLSWFIVARELK